MEMVSMAMGGQTEKETVLAETTPEYPYGLVITLNNETLGMLGLETLPVVGSALNIMARVKVAGVSQNERDEEGKQAIERMVELQITDMAFMPEKEEKKPAEDALYGLPKKQGKGREFLVE